MRCSVLQCVLQCIQGYDKKNLASFLRCVAVFVAVYAALCVAMCVAVYTGV